VWVTASRREVEPGVSDDPLEAIRLREGERVLWCGRPGGGISSRNLRSALDTGVLAAALILGSFVLLGLPFQPAWSFAFPRMLGVAAVLGALIGGGRLLSLSTQVNGCAAAILALMAPVLVLTWIFVAWRNPKQVLTLMLHPAFLVAGLAVAGAGAHVINRVLHAQRVRYYLTTRRACEIRWGVGGWVIGWSERLLPTEPLQFRILRLPNQGKRADIAFRSGRGRHVLRWIDEPELLVENLRQILTDAWAEDAAQEETTPAASPVPPPPPLPLAAEAVPRAWLSVCRLGHGERPLWQGRPGWGIEGLRRTLRGGLAVAGVFLGFSAFLITPALLGPPDVALAALTFVGSLIALVFGLAFLGLVLDRAIDLNRPVLVVLLLSLMILIPSVVEGLVTGRLATLLRDPVAWGFAAVGLAAGLHVAWCTARQGKTRYLLTQRRAFAISTWGPRLLWSIRLGRDDQDVRVVWTDPKRSRGHVRFGHGLGASDFRFLASATDVSELAQGAIRSLASPTAEPPTAEPPTAERDPTHLSPPCANALEFQESHEPRKTAQPRRPRPMQAQRVHARRTLCRPSWTPTQPGVAGNRPSISRAPWRSPLRPTRKLAAESARRTH
jgi:hypothetical protein